jgi:hypothetical protein
MARADASQAWGDLYVMSEIGELSARVAKLEAWVEAVMQTLAGMQVEPVLIELDEARCAYDEEDE